MSREMSLDCRSWSQSSNEDIDVTSQNGLMTSGESDTSSISSGNNVVAYSEDRAEDEKFTLEKLHFTRKQLEDEIKLMEEEIIVIGHESDFMTECEHLIQDHDDTVASRNLRTGRKKFNREPKDGMKYLIEKKLVNDSSEDVAMFLHAGELLDKSAIGAFLGEGKDYYIGVLQNFVELYDFADMNLVEALRMFLSGFRLPGEAQKIDRMMELFARRFCSCNPNVFKNPDSCYVLSFSIIMLNTSLHNPNVKEKPTVDQFISMNRGINDGSDFPIDMLKNLYDCIKTDPFEIHDGDDDLTQVFFNPDYEGYLIKEGGKHKSWCKRWFILSDNCLYYFKSPGDKEPRGIIPLENLEVKQCHDLKRPYCFEIISVPAMQYSHKGNTIKACKTTGQGKVVTGNHQVYRIQASSAEEMNEWMQRINASIASNPFMEMLQERRQRVSNRGPVIL